MKLPVVSGKDVVRVLTRLGWAPSRHRGSHVTLVKAGYRPITVPLHAELRRGTLRHVIGQAGLEVGEFIRILDEF